MTTVVLRPCEPRTVTHKRATITLARYDVEVDGTKVGQVFRDMATRERRSGRNRYVNARWTSPAWYYSVVGDFRRYGEQTSRREVLKRLLHETTPDIDWTDADALARDAKVAR